MKTAWRAIAAAVGLAFFAAACGTSDAGGASTGESTEAANTQLTFVSWGGGYQEAQESSFVKPWAEQAGVTLLTDGPTDYSKLRAQVESENVSWDVVTVEPFWAISACGTLLEEMVDQVDTSGIPDVAVSDCAIPIDIFSYVLVYDTTVFGDNPPTSWSDFFDTETYPGKRGIWNYAPGGQFEAALLADGVAPDDLYPLDIERAFSKLDTIRDDIAFYDTGAQQVQQLESQEVVMTIAWSGRALSAVRNGAPFEPVWTDHLMLVDSLVVPKGSENSELAIGLLEYATTIEAQNAFAEAYGYGPVHVEAEPDLDDTAQRFLPTAPDHFSQGLFIDQHWWAEHFDDTSAEWTKWSAG